MRRTEIYRVYFKERTGNVSIYDQDLIDRLVRFAEKTDRAICLSVECPTCGSPNTVNEYEAARYEIFLANASGIKISNRAEDLLREEEDNNSYKPGKGGVKKEKRFCGVCKKIFTVRCELTCEIEEEK